MDDLDQLVVVVAVLQLLVDVTQIVEVQLSLGLDVQEGKVSLPAFLAEGVALSGVNSTMRLVSSRRNCSKSRGAPLVVSQSSCKTRKTSSYLASSPRVLAVIIISLTSALLWRGSAQMENKAWSSVMCSGEKTGFLVATSLARTAFNSFSCISLFDIKIYTKQQNINQASPLDYTLQSIQAPWPSKYSSPLQSTNYPPTLPFPSPLSFLLHLSPELLPFPFLPSFLNKVP